MKFMRDTWIFFVYYLKSSFKSPVWIALALFHPVCYLYLYAPLLESLYDQTAVGKGEALKIFTPGLLVLLVIFGTMFVGFAMIEDLKSGVVERFSVLPVSRGAIILGRTCRDSIILLIQSLVLILLAIPLGLQIDFLAAIMILGIMLMVGLSFAPLSYALSLILKSEDTIGFVINFFVQPMILLSGILLPLTLAPYWLKKASMINPLKYVVDASRAVINGQFNDIAVIQGIVVLSLFVVFSLWLGTRAYNRALS